MGAPSPPKLEARRLSLPSLSTDTICGLSQRKSDLNACAYRIGEQTRDARPLTPCNLNLSDLVTGRKFLWNLTLGRVDVGSAIAW